MKVSKSAGKEKEIIISEIGSEILHNDVALEDLERERDNNNNNNNNNNNS